MNPLSPENNITNHLHTHPKLSTEGCIFAVQSHNLVSLLSNLYNLIFREFRTSVSRAVVAWRRAIYVLHKSPLIDCVANVIFLSACKKVFGVITAGHVTRMTSMHAIWQGGCIEKVEAQSMNSNPDTIPNNAMVSHLIIVIPKHTLIWQLLEWGVNQPYKAFHLFGIFLFGHPPSSCMLGRQRFDPPMIDVVRGWFRSQRNRLQGIVA